MKKICIVLIVALVLVVALYAPANIEHHLPQLPLINGIVLSEVSPQSFATKYPDIPIGMDKVDDAVTLAKHEFFDSEYSIPLFAKLDLFVYKKTSDKKIKLSDLEADYHKLKANDLTGREILSSVFVSIAKRGGVPLTYTKPSEPEINIKYIEVNAKKGTAYIPHRIVKFTNKVDTYFLLVPIAKPIKERLNAYDAAKVYDIVPSIVNTRSERINEKNSNLDFDGFFVNIPDVIPDKTYFHTVESTLKKVQKELHKRGKLLIVENLNNSDLSLGKSGDIVGLTSNGKIDENLLKKAREMYPDKTIFVTINGDFSQQNIKKALDELAFYGIYPEFGRDEKQGDFVYYEDKLGKSEGTIKNALHIITKLNEAGYKGAMQSNPHTNQFGKYPYLFFTVNDCSTLKIDKEKLGIDNTFVVLDGENSNKLAFRENGSIINVPLPKGTKVIRIAENKFMPLCIPRISFIMHSPVKRVAVRVVNAGNAASDASVKIKSGRRITFDSNLHFAPLQERYIYAAMYNNPISIAINRVHNTINIRNGPRSSTGITFLILIVLLLLMLCALKMSKGITKSLSTRQFFLFAISGSVALLLLNRYFIHYSEITITYFAFALLFLLFSLYDNQDIFASEAGSAIMLILGLIFNLFEFGTLLPQFFNLIPPIFASEKLLFYLPFVFTFIFFSLYGKKSFNKLEVGILLFSMGTVIFFSNRFSMLFMLETHLKDIYPLFIVLISVFVLSALYRKERLTYSIISAASILFLFLSLKFSALFFHIIRPNANSILFAALPLREAILFVIPFYFISLVHYNREKKTKELHLINWIFLFTFSIIFIFAFFDQWSLRVANIFAVETYSWAVYIPLMFISSVLLIEPWKKQ